MGTDAYETIARRFDDLTAARAEQQRLGARRAHLAPQLAEARGEVGRLSAQHDKEAGDVHRLEGGASPTRVWAAMRGGLQDQLAKERAEAEAARFNLARAEEVLRRLEREDQQLAAEEARVVGAQEGYEVTLAEVHRLAQEPGAGMLRERAAEAGRQLEDLRWRRELEEALATGREARAALAEARRRLGGAKAWSVYDTFGGGGMFSSMLKHDQLDKATALLDEAAAAMQRFSRELADVELPGLNAPMVDDMSRGLDIWFDNFVTDIMVSQRIAQADGQVAEAQAAVDDTMATLEELRAKLT